MTSRAGFVLIEALIAILVAALLVKTLSQSFAEARRTSRVALDIVAATALAQEALSRDAGDLQVPGYVITRHVDAVAVHQRVSKLAPAVTVSARDAPAPADETPQRGGSEPPAPGSQGKALSVVSAQLRRVSVAVTTPTGRKVGFETLRLELGNR